MIKTIYTGTTESLLKQGYIENINGKYYFKVYNKATRDEFAIFIDAETKEITTKGYLPRCQIKYVLNDVADIIEEPKLKRTSKKHK